MDLTNPPCHPDCGPIVDIDDDEHVHRNTDGYCVHENEAPHRPYVDH